MGAEFNVTTMNCRRDQLDAKVRDLISEAAYDHGHGGYSGSFAEKCGVEIEERVFDSNNEAENYICEHNDKWGPLTAVRVLREPKLTDTEEKRIAKIVGDNRALQQIVNAHQGADRRALLDKFLAQWKQGKSKTKGCAHCGSKLSVEHLSGVSCPVCRNSLLSATQEKQVSQLEAKAKAAQKKIAANHKTIKAIRTKRSELSKNNDTYWMVGGWCSS